MPEFVGNALGSVVEPVGDIANAYAPAAAMSFFNPLSGVASGAGELSALDAGMNVYGDVSGSAFATPSGLDAGMGVWGDVSNSKLQRSPLDAGMDNWFTPGTSGDPTGGTGTPGAVDFPQGTAAQPFQALTSNMQGSLNAPATLVDESVSGNYSFNPTAGSSGGSAFEQLLERIKKDPFKSLSALGTTVNTGTGIWGLLQSQQLAKQAQGAAERASGPWDTGGGRAAAAAQLQALSADPNTFLNGPINAANTQAVMRRMAPYGNSGNLATALQASNTAGLQAEFARLGGEAGININPAAGAAVLMQGQNNANNLALNSLGLLGKTAVNASENKPFQDWFK